MNLLAVAAGQGLAVNDHIWIAAGDVLKAVQIIEDKGCNGLHRVRKIQGFDAAGGTEGCAGNSSHPPAAQVGWHNDDFAALGLIPAGDG